MAQLPVPLPGYVAGRWKIDPTHSEVSLVIRHTLIHLRGTFTGVNGVIETTDDLLSSHAEVTIDPASFWSGSPVRDEKIRHWADFLESGKWPEITFRSTSLEPAGDDRRFRLNGLLTCRGVSKAVTLDALFNGFGRSNLYGYRMGFSAETTLDRRDFGIVTTPPPVESTIELEEGPSMLGNTLRISIQVEAVLENDEGKYRW